MGSVWLARGELLGPGGAGKTRLAIEVGRGLLDRYPGGIWFLPLDTLEDGSLLPAAIGRVVGKDHGAVVQHGCFDLDQLCSLVRSAR